MVERPKLHLDRRLPGKSTSMTSTAGIRKCRRMKPETSFMRRWTNDIGGYRSTSAKAT